MKLAGKKAGLMPQGASDATESAAPAKKDATKKTGSFQGEPNKLGGGGRFRQMVAQGKSPALAAYIGRKVYGKSKMANMSAAGKKSA